MRPELPILPRGPLPSDHYANVTRAANEIRGAVGDHLIAAELAGGLVRVRWIGPPVQSSPPRYLAAITASALMAGHQARWLYTFAQVRLSAGSGGAYELVDGGVSGSAINLAEMGHTAEPGDGIPWFVWGENVHAADWPDTYGPRPVGGGGTSGAHQTDVVVEVTRRLKADGTIAWTFDRMGSNDGVCDE